MQKNQDNPEETPEIWTIQQTAKGKEFHTVEPRLSGLSGKW